MMEKNGIIYDADTDFDSEGVSQYLTIKSSQSIICHWFVEIVNQAQPEQVFNEFEQVFFNLSSSRNSEVTQALNRLILEEDELGFREILKRSFYILINNWIINRQNQLIQQLFQIIESEDYENHLISPSINLLRNWTQEFLNSSDYQEIKNYALKTKPEWTHRYQSYLLATQYVNSSETQKQNETAITLAQKLKDQYKFDLAMYVARSECPTVKGSEAENPTQLGDAAIRLIKKTISTQRVLSYAHQADFFLDQTQNLSYLHFKESLLNYLMLHVSSQYPANIIRDKLHKKLEVFEPNSHQSVVTKSLIAKTCKYLIRLLTTEKNQEPSISFLLLTSHGSFLTLAILLIKIILICHSAQAYLEYCIALLIQYYQNLAEEKCKKFINFIEVFNLVFTLFTANVQYNLVHVKENKLSPQLLNELDAYRLFCQFKGPDLRHVNLRSLNLSGANLQGADLRDMDLRGIDLIQVDLRLANLSRANLSGAILNEAQLLIANLSQADLSEASLIKADVRRGVLQGANLAHASLTSAKFSHANLQQTNLSEANLMAANLNGSDLSQANLFDANLESADLRGANLSSVNLSHANLRNANLQGANLSGANLGSADLRGANLSHANFEQANLRCANFYQANLSYTNFQNANLRKVNLNRTRLNHANLQGANLTCAILRHAHLNQTCFHAANLERADLTRTDLTNVDFSNANLSLTFIRHAKLNKTNFSEANLSSANLFGSDFTHAQLQGAKFEQNSGLSELMKHYLGLDYLD